MLISPAKIHSALTSLLSPTPTLGPHCALLITPQGQLVAVATLPDEDDDSADGEDGDNGGEEDGEGEGEGEGEDEPYLDPPARLRLLLGLASQWGEDESPKMECELGRLHFTSLPLPPPDASANQALLPEQRPRMVERFVLVLNGRNGTAWDVLGTKAEEFKKGWKA
ncbi:hypothetical protein IAT38_005803 [Cryptococcus sp. DSM 104549]